MTYIFEFDFKNINYENFELQINNINSLIRDGYHLDKIDGEFDRLVLRLKKEN